MFFIVLLTISGCSLFGSKANQQKPNLKPGSFSFQALKKSEIFELQTKNDKLFAGTSKGLVSFNLSNGLKHVATFKKKHYVNTFLILNRHNWLISAGIYKDTDFDSSAIYKSTDQGKTWVNYTNGYGGNKYRRIPYSMDALPENPSVIFALSPSVINVAKSTDGGESWESLITTWKNPLAGTSIFVKIDPNNPNIIWAGGATAMFYSSLLKSKDGGNTWKRMVGLYMGGNIVYALGISVNNSNHLLAGLNGGVAKSIDGGKNWHAVLQKPAIYAFVHSSRNHRIIYASGLSPDSTLFLPSAGILGIAGKQ